jgi:hypothetical protein
MEHAMTHVTTRLVLTDTAPVRPTVLRRHPVAIFFVLTYAIAWAFWVPLVILQDRMPPAPELLLTILGSSTPSVLAILLVARLQGRAEVRHLLRRLLMGRVNIGWYAAIVALTALPVMAVWVSTLLGAPAPVVVVTIPGALSLFLPFALSCVIMSIFYTWMYNGTGGSLLLAVLLHAATNLPLTIVMGPLEQRVLPSYWIYDALLAVAAAALIARTGASTLSRTHAKQTVTV